MDWKALVHLTDDELATYDIAEVSLSCAVGIPDANFDLQKCLATIDHWTECVRKYTSRCLPAFHRQPEQYDDSEAYFRILALVTALQRDLGVKYNPLKIPEDAPFGTPDTFLHGIIEGGGGTCATIPVVYAAVGRRLGYPIKLVTVYGGEQAQHLFARWDAKGSRFNIEATAPGLRCPPDEYYRSGRYQCSPKVEKGGGFLISMTPRQELAMFLTMRGLCWHEFGNFRNAVDAFAWALCLQPENKLSYNTLVRECNAWGDAIRAKQPPGFPQIYVTWPQKRRFPNGMPDHFERDVLFLGAWESIVFNSDIDKKYWGPMRSGKPLQARPDKIRLHFNDSGYEVAIDVTHNPTRSMGIGDYHV